MGKQGRTGQRHQRLVRPAHALALSARKDHPKDAHPALSLRFRKP
jgi:hypothetical protein